MSPAAKIIIAGAVLVPLGIVAYFVRARSVDNKEAFAMYRKFAEAYHKDRIAECRSISDGPAMKELIDKREERHHLLARVGTQAGGMPEASATFKENSLTRNGDEVIIDATMIVKHVIASGLTPAKDVPHTDYAHSVTLRKQGGGWVVVAFTETETR